MSQAIGLTLLFLLLQLVTGIVLGIATGGKAPGPVGIAIGNGASFAGVLWIAASWAGLRVRRFVPLGPIPMSLAIPMMLTVLGASAITSDVANLVSWLLPPPDFIKELFSDVLGGRSNPLMALALIVIIAPVTEEILFRGILLRGMLQRYKPWKAIVFTAGLFAFIHLNPWQFPIAMMLGVVFGWWFYRTRSLWPCVLGHAMNNFLPALFAAIPRFQIAGYTTTEGSEFQPLWFDLTGLTVLILGVVWTYGVFARIPQPILARAVPAAAPVLQTDLALEGPIEQGLPRTTEYPGQPQGLDKTDTCQL